MYSRGQNCTQSSLNTFFSYLDDGVEGILSKFAENTKLGEAADTSESHATHQEGSGQAIEMGWQKFPVQQGKVWSPEPKEEQSHVSVRAWVHTDGKQFCRKGPRIPSKPQIEHE